MSKKPKYFSDLEESEAGMDKFAPDEELPDEELVLPDEESLEDYLERIKKNIKKKVL
jgi:hypothetical protein